jgi:hypothetical protein
VVRASRATSHFQLGKDLSMRLQPAGYNALS